tara:strand:+ start:528 stop:734 length:207 start_codon:yes stop_codon:yes gene_type:complete
MTLLGKIMQFFFIGKLNKYQKKIASNKELSKATAEFEKASKEYDKTLEKYKKKGVEFKVGEPVDLDKL